MRCKVPAASGPRGLLATHAPPRRPEVPPAAHTDRMLQTPPDIATRSQSAGRGVNLPAASSAAPRQAPAQLERALPPPEHAWGLAASTHQGVSSPLGTPSPASPVGFQTQGLGLGRVGLTLGFVPNRSGSACLCTRLSEKLIPFPRGRGRWRPLFQVEADACVLWLPTSCSLTPQGRGPPFLPDSSPRAAQDCLPLASSPHPPSAPTLPWL